MAIDRLFVANRGEIAVRIVRAARELGIATVQAASAADRDMLAARLADETVEIGPAHASKSYLSIEAILKAAIASGCDAVHPGYGFLSENAGFAQAVEEAGLVFVGPRSETIRAMGDKAKAREIAEKAGVPVVPGSRGTVAAIEEAAAEADRIGYPVMLKAAAGAGGVAFAWQAMRTSSGPSSPRPAPRPRRPSAMAGSTSSASSREPAMSRFR